MITASDSVNTVDLGSYYAILPSGQYTLQAYCDARAARPVPPGFSYNSGSNPQFLSVAELRALIARELNVG
jgi:hypothetical protein